MKALFPGYFPPSEAEVEKRWTSAIIVLDASFLLNLYYLTPAAQKQILRTLRDLRPRLFVPHRAALEYLKNRLGCIKKVRDELERLSDGYKSAVRQLTDRGQKNPEFSRSSRKLMLASANAANADVQRSVSRVKKLAKFDTIQAALIEILAERIGEGFDEKATKEIYQEGKSRYAAKIPPGYEDDAKPEPDRYGDLVIWKEILKRGEKLHVFVITGDNKKDWWWKGPTNENLGPRPELVAEALTAGLLSVHMYSSDRFLENARRFGHAKITPSTIDEVRANISTVVSSSVLPSMTAPQQNVFAPPSGSSVLGGNPFNPFAPVPGSGAVTGVPFNPFMVGAGTSALNVDPRALKGQLDSTSGSLAGGSTGQHLRSLGDFWTTPISPPVDGSGDENQVNP